jgi:tetratricopeptide (TPR) repeat protein/tRNA A-37 threonylcarbamoyl transferase component Bud32
MSASPCPDVLELQQFLLGQLPAAEIDRLAQHLLHCDRCVGLAGTLEARDRLVDDLHAQKADGEETDHEALRTLLSRVQDPALLLSLPPTRRETRRETLRDPGGTGVFIPPTGEATAEQPDLWCLPGRPAEGARRGSETAVDAARPLPDPGWPKLADYEVVGILGRGGMGVVYKARQKSLKRLVALKMLLSGDQAQPQELARFRSEAEAIARLNHPNIVQIYEVGEHQGRPFFSLELLEGGSLASKLMGTPQDAGTAARVVETLARAVHAVHECGIIHRDLKPGNVLLTGGPDVPLGECMAKIGDFGLAKALDADAGQTGSGQVVGTPSYMAPEQAKEGPRQLGPAVDVYALGAILYDLLTGRPPFKAATFWDTVMQLLNKEPVPPRRLHEAVPRDLERVCLKCLEKEPHRRYASPLDLADDLRRFLDGEPVRARPAPAWERAWKWSRRRPALAALVGVLCLAPAVLLGLDVWHSTVLTGELTRTRAAEALIAKEANTQERLKEGRAALDRGALDVAEGCFARAAEKAAQVPPLAGLMAEAQQGLDETHRRQAAQAERAKAQAERDKALANYRRFLERRDEALLHASQSAGLDLPDNVQATRAAARSALELFGLLDPGARAGEALEESPLGEGERNTVRADAYELLLILAAAEAQPLAPEDARRQGEKALQVLDRAAQLRAPTRAYYRQRAAHLAARGDAAGAATENARADALGPENAVDHFLLGVEAYRRQELGQAILSFQTASGLQPKHFWAEYFLAVCFLRSQRPDLAEARLTACQGWRPDLAWVYILRGFAYGELGARARGAGRQEAETYFKAGEADFARALECRPLDEQAHYNLLVNRGVLRLREKKWAGAVADFQDAIRRQPERLSALVDLAEAYQEQQKWNDAAAALDRAIGLQRDFAPLYRARARVAQKCGDLEAALRDMEKAIALQPAGSRDAAEDQIERGQVLCQREQYAEAVRAFDAALQVLPGNPLAQRWRGAALLELKRYDEAIAAFDDYLKHGKPVAAVYEARGLAREKRDDLAGALAGALADYGQALALEPGSSRLHTERGWAYLRAGAVKLALDDFNEAVRLDPTSADAYAGRGSARAKLGKYRQAVADAAEAQQKGPRTFRHLYNLARIFAQAVDGIDAERSPLPTLRAHYQDQAVELLQRAFNEVPSAQCATYWRDYVQADGALNSIRASAGYRQLASQYGGPAK